MNDHEALEELAQSDSPSPCVVGEAGADEGDVLESEETKEEVVAVEDEDGRQEEKISMAKAITKLLQETELKALEKAMEEPSKNHRVATTKQQRKEKVEQTVQGTTRNVSRLTQPSTEESVLNESSTMVAHFLEEIRPLPLRRHERQDSSETVPGAFAVHRPVSQASRAHSSGTVPAQEPRAMIERRDPNPLNLDLEASQDVEDNDNSGLASAYLVEEEAMPLAESIHGPTPSEEEEARQKTTERFLLCLRSITVLFLLLVGSLFGVVGFLLRNKRTSAHDDASVGSSHFPSNATTAPTGAPTRGSPARFLEVLLKGLPDSSLQNLNIYGTPQWKAFVWLENHPDLPEMKEWRMRQLFALAAFYHDMEGPNWPAAIKNDWLQYTDECFWFSTGFGKFNYATGLWEEQSRYDMTPCNARNEFQLLDLVGLDLEDYNPHLPEEIALLTSLKVIALNENHISAHISDFLPRQLYQMTNLTSLNLGENHLDGRIPSQLGLLMGLLDLFLNSNTLSGEIPSELGLLTLASLHLHLNHLTGPIPLELAHVSGMTSLELWGNSLTGPIPSEVGAMTTLKNVALDYNYLTASVPTSLGYLSNMTHLWLSHNSLTGEVPQELGELVSSGTLELLQLQFNDLTGTITEDLCALGLNSSDWNGLSFDCSVQLCGCCWCPCEGTNVSTDCPWSLDTFEPSKDDEEWPGSFPTPFNSSNVISINIHTDEYPEETSWEWSMLEAETGEWDTLDSVDGLLGKEMLFSYTKDVQSDATYRLKLCDRTGDGTCCGYGLGWFSITTSAPSTDYSAGTVIWNATGEVLGETLDVILAINSAGFAEVVDSIEG